MGEIKSRARRIITVSVGKGTQKGRGLIVTKALAKPDKSAYLNSFHAQVGEWRGVG